MPLSKYDAHYSLAEEALSWFDRGLEESIGATKKRCTRNGVLSVSLLDNHQVTVAEIANASAELAAARSALEYSKAVQEKDNLIAELGLVFVSEILGQLRARINAHLSGIYDFGILPQSISTLQSHYTSTAVLERLGEDLINRNGRPEPWLQTEELDMARDTFARFAQSVVSPVARQIHVDKTDIPSSLIAGAAELGCFALSVPERFGGLQDDHKPDSLGMVVVTEVLSAASLGAAGSLITRPEIVVRALLAGGTRAQQEHWLPLIANGEVLTAVAVTEAHCGSDVAAVKMRARRTSGGWLLSGTKSWSTFAGSAHLILVLVRTDPDPDAGHRGLSLFLVSKPPFEGESFSHTQPEGGKLEGQSIPTIGYRGMHTFNLFFEDYFVCEDGLLGAAQGENQGFYYTMQGFSGGRIQTAARAVGVMQAAFDSAFRYACERVVFNRPVAAFALTRTRLIRMFATLIACRRFTYDAASSLDAGEGHMVASMVKLFTCRMAEHLTREAMQIHGAMGYAEESDVSRYFVDARVLSIFEGTEEILALKVIGKTLLEQAG